MQLGACGTSVLHAKKKIYCSTRICWTVYWTVRLYQHFNHAMISR